MSAYYCETCGEFFCQPLHHQESHSLDGWTMKGCTYLCPSCCEPYIEEAEECPGCGGGFKRKHEILCRACRTALKERFSDFADTLTAEEEAQLDEWMDGDTITNRQRWDEK